MDRHDGHQGHCGGGWMRSAILTIKPIALDGGVWDELSKDIVVGWGDNEYDTASDLGCFIVESVIQLERTINESKSVDMRQDFGVDDPESPEIAFDLTLELRKPAMSEGVDPRRFIIEENTTHEIMAT